MAILYGRDISIYRTLSISLGEAKKENRDNIKSRLVFISAKNVRSGIAKPVKITLFEEEIGKEAYDELVRCRKMDDQGKPTKDVKGGDVVDIILLMEESRKRIAADPYKEDPWFIDKILRIEGGMMETYIFPDGPRYANGADNKPTLDKDNNKIKMDRVQVFVQLDWMDDKEKHYCTNYDPESRGRRIMNTFFKTPVETTVQKVEEENEPTF